MKNPAAAADLLTAIRGTVIAALEHHGIDRSTAQSTADRSCELLLQHWGGAEHWLPSLDRKIRDARILQAARRGQSAGEVASELGISRSTIKRVIRSQRSGIGREDWVL